MEMSAKPNFTIFSRLSYAKMKVSIEKKLASTILLVLMICATAAFVWFTFWYKVLL